MKPTFKGKRMPKEKYISKIEELRILLNLFDVLRAKLDQRKKQLIKHADEKVATEIDANDNNGNWGEENGAHP
ncbi:hypothetical protein H5410_042693 [Solanum commersonii]|uniref:Uncharacterized protein n=1 Tax=Solanum commersonii TaxID=4109 RepID=A0A9J5XV36_SOLCO|nr:hypothetical protein H5410_042693 [Solanum commersonii]